ncbi:MAG TPA: DUF2231 domain-containing protein [Pyrinomonadaceae bacterium]|nr:DUF2231 domain-containing protein [Pyrinomonadaceae bacterium]
MKPGIRLFGHAIHPMLIVFPLGLLSTAVIFDVVYYATLNPAFPTVAFWLIGAGIIGGLIAAIFGLIDWLAIPSGTRAKTIGAYHGLVNLVVVLLFAGSWYLRSGTTTEPPTLAIVLSALGFALALVGGWLGGELVERLGVAVHEGANVNAPSSLTSENVASVRMPAKKI